MTVKVELLLVKVLERLNVTKNTFFLLCLGSSSSFVTNRIQLNTNASNITVEEGFLADALVFIKFPQGDISALQFICKLVSHVKHSQDQHANTHPVCPPMQTTLARSR